MDSKKECGRFYNWHHYITDDERSTLEENLHALAQGIDEDLVLQEIAYVPVPINALTGKVDILNGNEMECYREVYLQDWVLPAPGNTKVHTVGIEIRPDEGTVRVYHVWMDAAEVWHDGISAVLPFAPADPAGLRVVRASLLQHLLDIGASFRSMRKLERLSQ